MNDDANLGGRNVSCNSWVIFFLMASLEFYGGGRGSESAVFLGIIYNDYILKNISSQI